MYIVARQKVVTVVSFNFVIPSPINEGESNIEFFLDNGKVHRHNSSMREPSSLQCGLSVFSTRYMFSMLIVANCYLYISICNIFGKGVIKKTNIALLL